MELANGARAVVDIAKLRDYCLSPFHPEGKHKARVFQSALGIGAEDAEWLREQLLECAGTAECEPSGNTSFGSRFVIDSVLRQGSFSSLVRSAWVIRTGEDCPRLVSCYVR